MVVELAFAVMAGMTVSGTSASVMELVTGRPVSFAAPSVSLRHLPRLFLAAALAGPLMLANDALQARRARDISVTYFVFCAGTSLVWATALGTACVGLAAGLVAHLS